MYEETKIKFDWKGFLLKFAIIILVVILVIKLLPTKQKSHSESFTSNLTKLKDVSINYFKISKLQDYKGKECDEENSYIEATKNGNEYEVEVYLKCGNEEDTINIYKTMCEETKCNETTTTTTKKTTTKKANNNTNNTSNNQRPATTKKVEYITKVITKEKKYYVVFDTDKAASIPTQTLKLGEKATRPQTPTKEGYTFLGWYYNNKEYDFNSPVTSNIILTAKWQQN